MLIVAALLFVSCPGAADETNVAITDQRLPIPDQKTRASNRAKIESIFELATQLGECQAANQWSIEDADRWWSRHERGLLPASGASKPAAETKDEAVGQTVDEPQRRVDETFPE